MKKYASIMATSLMLLLVLVGVANAAPTITIAGNYMVVTGVPVTAYNIVAQSDRLGWGNLSIARGKLNVAKTAFVIPNTALKDAKVSFVTRSSTGVLKWLDTCKATVKSGNTAIITHVTKNADCTISYRYKGFPVTTPTLSFDGQFLYGNMGTNIMYGAGSAHIPFAQLAAVEWNSDRSGWNANSKKGTFSVSAKGDIAFKIDVPMDDIGQPSVVQKGTGIRSYFNIASWANSTGVTKYGTDRYMVGVYEQGSISYNGSVLTVDMGYDFMPTVPPLLKNISCHMVSDRLGWGNGVVATPEKDAQGHVVCKFYNKGANDNRLANDLVNNDALAFRVDGLDLSNVKKSYWLPLKDFKAGSGVTLTTDRVVYGTGTATYASAVVSRDVANHQLLVNLNSDVLEPFSGDAKVSDAVNIQFISSGSFTTYAGTIQKNAQGNLYAVISGIAPADCGHIAIKVNGVSSTGGDKEWMYGLGSLVKLGTGLVPSANGEVICF